MPIPKSEYMSSVWRDGIFDGKVVFCTGGAGSICSVQVRALVHLGANACIIGRNVEKTESMAKDIATVRKGAKVIGIGAVDVRRLDSLQEAVDRCVKELGGIDYVIAGAAGNFLAPITGLSANAFKSVIDIDVIGSYNTLKVTMPYLEKSGTASPNTGINETTGGRIIFVSATLHYHGTPFQAHVCAAKAAIDALSATAAIELGPRGMTSNVIAPGPIANTEGMERLSGTEGRSKGPRKVPVGRYGLCKEIADATIYLFSDAGSYVNGHCLVVDGGHWRVAGSSMGAESGEEYPDVVLTGRIPTGAKSGRKESKL